MFEQKYPILCPITGQLLGEGDKNQLQEYFNIMGLGEPFDAAGQLNYPEPIIKFGKAKPPEPKP